MAQLLGQVAVGSIVKLNENGSPTNYIVVHQGNPSTAGRATVQYDESCTGTWILRESSAGNGNVNSTDVNPFSNSRLYYWLQSTMLKKYDIAAQNKIIQAKIPYCTGNGGNSIMQGENGLCGRHLLLCRER